VNPLDRIAEEKLARAAAEGVFDDLPGKGKPLELEDLSHVPPELRAGYSLLKGAGYLPEELELQQRCVRLAELLEACTDDEEGARLAEELRGAHLRYRLFAERNGSSAAAGEYRAAILRKLGS